MDEPWCQEAVTKFSAQIITWIAIFTQGTVPKILQTKQKCPQVLRKWAECKIAWKEFPTKY